MQLYLIRHPRPLCDAATCYGSTDVGVDPREVAKELATLLPMLPAKRLIYTSPLQRCTALARPLATALTGIVIEDRRLVELDFGAWENRAWAGIPRTEIDAWAADPVYYRPGGGESVVQAAERVRSFLHSAREQETESAIVVCHAGIIRLARAWQEESNPADAAARAARDVSVAPVYGSLTILEL